MHLAEEMGGEDGAAGEQHESGQEVAHTARGNPEQADEENEEQGGEPDVVLQPDHRHGGTPGPDDGNEGPWIEHQPVAEPGGRDGEDLLVRREVGG